MWRTKMNICKLLLNIDNDYNQHKQTNIKRLSIKQGLKLCKALEKYTNHSHLFVLEVYSDKSFTIYQKDYFKEPHTGSRDRMILGSDGE